MKKSLLAGAALVWVGTAMLLAQQEGTSARPQTTATAPPVQSAAPSRAASQAPAGGQGPSAAAEAAKQRAWLNKYCVGCHNNRTKNPSEDPVNLESASVDDLLPSAATWERVLRKLAVRSMRPRALRIQRRAISGFTTGCPHRSTVPGIESGRYGVVCSRDPRVTDCPATARTSDSTTSRPR
jgi:hypothetical protein